MVTNHMFDKDTAMELNRNENEIWSDETETWSW